jgi:hypothetical protein
MWRPYQNLVVNKTGLFAILAGHILVVHLVERPSDAPHEFYTSFGRLELNGCCFLFHGLL